MAEGALRLTLAQLGVVQTTAPLEALSRLEPYPDAQQALARLREAGAAVAVLTNGGEDDTRGLLRKGDLETLVGELVSIDEARAFKPHPSTYALVLRRLGRDPGRVAMVAAHAWDCLGAGAAGMRAVWVDRLEAVWSLPAEEPERARSLVEAVDLLVRGQAGAATTQRRTGS